MIKCVKCICGNVDCDQPAVIFDPHGMWCSSEHAHQGRWRRYFATNSSDRPREIRMARLIAGNVRRSGFPVALVEPAPIPPKPHGQHAATWQKWHNDMQQLTSQVVVCQRCKSNRKFREARLDVCGDLVCNECARTYYTTIRDSHWQSGETEGSRMHLVHAF